MDYSKFYTPPDIAKLLIKQLHIKAPQKAIDICCGSCNLLYAAKEQWPEIELIGIDIVHHDLVDVNFKKQDGRDYSINTNHKYSLVLANPPFDFIDNRENYPDLYNALPLDMKIFRLETEMLLANLKLLKSNGVLLIIMPSSFIESEQNKKIRQHIGNTFHIRQIIKLPEETFGSSKINSYALVISNYLKKKHRTCSRNIVKKDGEFIISPSNYISQKNIKLGKWSIFNPPVSMQYNLDIRRGNISSQYFCDSGEPILHTAKAQHPWRPSMRYVKHSSKSPIYAEYGDIIVSRIGQSAGQWHQYKGKQVLISDCLYRIKDVDGNIAQQLSGNMYSLPLKGIATRYITINDFYQWFNSLTEN